MKPITKAIYSVLSSKGFKGSYILNITQNQHIITTSLQLPANKEISELEELLPNIQQELKATDYRISERLGKRIRIEFTTNNLEEILFTKSLLQMNTLQLKLPTCQSLWNLQFLWLWSPLSVAPATASTALTCSEDLS